jgi:hypothetical protein
LLFLVEERFVRTIGCARRSRTSRESKNRRVRARADKIVQDYLSEAEQDSTADTFPMIGLPNDISRTDRAVRQAFEAALKLMIQSFEQAANGNAEARRANALAIAALCVGGMVLSRSIDDRKLGDELRGAAKATALDLGKW